MAKRPILSRGGLLLMGGILLDLGVHLAAVLHMPEVRGWDSSTGHYRSSLIDSGGYGMFWLSMVWIAEG